MIMPDTNTLFVLFAVLCAVQFLFPILASIIKERFSALGYKMKANPLWSLLNVTSFWGEAREANRKYNDPEIKKYLLLRAIWWVLVIITFVGIIISVNS